MIGKRSTSNHQKQSQLSSVLNSKQNILYINLKFKVTDYTLILRTLLSNTVTNPIWLQALFSIFGEM